MSTTNQVWNSSRSYFLFGTGGFYTEPESGPHFSLGWHLQCKTRMSTEGVEGQKVDSLPALVSSLILCASSMPLPPKSTSLSASWSRAQWHSFFLSYHGLCRSKAISTSHREVFLSLGSWADSFTLWEKSAPGSNFAKNFQFAFASCGLRWESEAHSNLPDLPHPVCASQMLPRSLPGSPAQHVLVWGVKEREEYMFDRLHSNAWFLHLLQETEGLELWGFAVYNFRCTCLGLAVWWLDMHVHSLLMQLEWLTL